MARSLLRYARSLALLIAPELDPDAVRRRTPAYVLAFAVAGLAAFLIWDASAGATMAGTPVSNRANMGAW